MIHFPLRLGHSTAAVLIISVFSSSLPAQEHEKSHAAHEKSGSSHVNTYGGSGEPTIVASVRAKDQPAVGKTTEVLLSLKSKDGKPVPVTDLDVMHTEPIHLLIIDPSLGDYHHIHPPPADDPGTYTFLFTPRRAGTYNVYCDLHPKATAVQEYSLATIEVPGTPSPVEKKQERKVTSGDYTFELVFENPNLMQGKSTGATVTVTGPDGKPFDRLEPIMGAFAHMVGFSEDRMNVAHVHPLGKEPEKAEERGGPTLKFHVGLPHPGYHVLYVQVQIAAKDVFAPFGVEVAPRRLPEDAAGIMMEVDETVEKLDNIANAGPLHKVHSLAAEASELLAALPERAPDLNEQKMEQLQTSLKRVKALAAQLDKYGDSNKAEETKALMPKFKGEVAAIHKLVGTTAKSGAGIKILGNTRCPVSGMAVGSMEPGAALVYNNTKIGLCCTGCTESFMKNPEAGLKKAQESAKK